MLPRVGVHNHFFAEFGGLLRRDKLVLVRSDRWCDHLKTLHASLYCTCPLQAILILDYRVQRTLSESD